MRITMDDLANSTNQIRVLDAEGNQMGCLHWVNLVTHECGQAVLGEPQLIQAGTSEFPVSTNERRVLTNPDGTVKTQVVKYSRIEITARQAQ